MAERIERTWDGKTFVFVNCCDYGAADVSRIYAESDYTVVQLDRSTSDFWQNGPGELVVRSDYLFIWLASYGQALSDFADAVIAFYDALENPADFVNYSLKRIRRPNTFS